MVHDGHNINLGTERLAYQGSPRSDQQGRDNEIGVELVRGRSPTSQRGSEERTMQRPAVLAQMCLGL